MSHQKGNTLKMPNSSHFLLVIYEFFNVFEAQCLNIVLGSYLVN